MGMNFYANTIVSMFDRFSIVLPSNVDYFQDGLPGKRCFFITDKNETFTVSFEEGMEMMDILPGYLAEPRTFSYTYQNGKRYIHEKRTDPSGREGIGSFAFFHIEMEDDEGNSIYIPGQMVAPYGYEWSDGVEPILIEILNGVKLFT